MIIGIDIDDTITDRNDYVQPLVLDYFKRSGKNFRMVNANADSMLRMFDWQQEDFVEYIEKEGYEYLVNAPVRADAVEVINRLKKEGHRIVIITAREMLDPYKTSKDLLDKHGIKYDKIVVKASNKTLACKENNVEIFIDDLVSTVDDLNDNDIKAFIMEAFSNKNAITNSPYVKSFKEFYDVIQKLDRKICVNNKANQTIKKY